MIVLSAGAEDEDGMSHRCSSLMQFAMQRCFLEAWRDASSERVIGDDDDKDHFVEIQASRASLI
jgi:hypothetical protein